MKKGLLGIFVFSVTLSWSQSIPEESIKDFNNRFNNHGEANEIIWNSLADGYEVSYEFNERNGYVYYNTNGLFKLSRLSVHFEELEQGVQNYVIQNYPNATIKYCYRLNTLTAPERSAIELEYNGQLIKLFFRPDGSFHYTEQ